MSKQPRKTRSRRPASRPAANSAGEPSFASQHGVQIGTVVAIGIVAALGIVLWRGNALPRLPVMLGGHDDSKDWLPALPNLRAKPSRLQSLASAVDWSRLPKIDSEKLGDLSRGLDALKSLFSRA